MAYFCKKLHLKVIFDTCQLTSPNHKTASTRCMLYSITNLLMHFLLKSCHTQEYHHKSLSAHLHYLTDIALSLAHLTSVSFYINFTITQTSQYFPWLDKDFFYPSILHLGTFTPHATIIFIAPSTPLPFRLSICLH